MSMTDEMSLSQDVGGFASNRPAGAAVTPEKPPAMKAVARNPASAVPAQAPEQKDPSADELLSKLDDTPAPQAAPDAAPAQPSADDLLAKLADAPAQNPKLSPMQSYVQANLAAHGASKPPAQPGEPLPEENGSFLHDLMAGLGLGYSGSVTGLALNGKMPDRVLPEHADMAMRIASSVGQMAGDLPAMLAGGFLGGGEGAAAGGAAGAPFAGVGAIPGALGGGTVGAMAGAFALPAAMRKMLIDHYQRGDITSPREFVSRLMGTTWEALKGATTGAATAVAGGAGGAAMGTIGKLGSELATMTTVGAALEGHLPKFQDFVDGAIVIGGIHAISGGLASRAQPDLMEKQQNITAKTGVEPADLVQAADTDVTFKQQLVAGNAQEPPEAAPTKLVHEPLKEPGAEGEPEKIVGTTTRLEPKTEEEVIGKMGPPTPVEHAVSEIEDWQAVLSKIDKPQEAPAKTWGQAFSDAYTKSVDYLNPWNVAIRMATERGAKITPETNAENLAREAKSHMDRYATFVEHGIDELGIKSEPLKNIFSDIEADGKDRNKARAYAIAQNAIEEFEKHGRDPYPGFDEEQARRVVKNLGPDYDSYNQRRIAFGNSLLEWAQKKGRYSEEQVSQWKVDHEFYSPQSRVFEMDPYEGESPRGAGGAIKARSGSDQYFLADPFAQTYINTEKVVKNVLINEARNQFVRNMDAGKLINREPEGRWSEAIPPVLTPVEASNFLGETPGKDGEPGKPIVSTPPLKDNQIAIYENGKRRVYEGSPILIDSMKRLEGDSTAMDMVSKILRGFTNTLRTTVTSNPAFGFAHEFRTQLMAGVNSKTGLIPFIHPLLAGFDMKMDNPEFRQFVERGGAGGRWLEPDKAYLASDLAQAEEKTAPWYSRAWNSSLNPLHYSEGFIRLADTATKFSEFQRSRAQGAGVSESLANSRMVLPDYTNVGLQRSVLRTGVAFIGAHINSLDNLNRVLQRDPIGALTKLSVLGGMSAMLWAVNKDDEAIESLPDWQKNLYWNINLSRFDPSYKGPSDATILRLPKPWAPGVIFGSGTELMLDEHFKYRPQELPHFLETLGHSVIPEVVPNMLQPVLDQYSNKQAFTGRPLVPRYKENLLPEMKYGPYTSETAKGLAKLIGYVPFVRDIGTKEAPLAAPAVVENYIHTWSGTLGQWALKLSDTALQESGATPSVNKAAPWEDTPFVHSFVSRFPSFQDQRIQDFYENKDHADQAYNSMRAAAKSGDFASAQAIMAAHPDFQVRLNGIAKGISTLRKTYENVQDNPSLPALEKRQLLDGLMFQVANLAKTGNKMMDDFRNVRGQTTANGRK